jgi:hypothetical protein
MELFKPPPIVKNQKRELRDRLIGAAGNRTGVKMHPHAARGADLYETPREAVHALLGVESIQGPVWECAAGRGAIVRALREAGHKVIGTDLIDYDSPDSRGGCRLPAAAERTRRRADNRYKSTVPARR